MIKDKKGLIAPIFVFLLTLLTHGINLWGFPKFLGDEGTYTSQAWWLARFGKLAPYTYWYDHSPFGWIQIGLWQRLTGGPFAFGFSLFSTRIFMVLVAAVCNLTLFYLIKEIAKSERLALVGSLLFALFPINILYHRQVLLDNLEVLWLLPAFLFLFKAKDRLKYIWWSAVFFGLSFLSKETAIVFLPVFIYGVFLLLPKANRKQGTVLWLITSFFLISLFPLLSVLKGEFLPASITGGEHVSFLETVLFQMTRGSTLKAWELGSYFQTALSYWFSFDPLFLGILVWSFLVCLFFLKQKELRLLWLGGILYFLFLARGGLVLDFYLIPLLPFVAILFSLAVGNVVRELKILKKLSRVVGVGAIGGVVGMVIYSWPVYSLDLTSNQLAAVDFIKNNLEPESVLVVDDYAFMDLRLSRWKADQAFPKTEWYSKVENDPEIKDKKLVGDWQNIDYFMVDDYVKGEMSQGFFPFLAQAFANGQKIKEFLVEEDMKEEWDWLEMNLEILKVSPRSGFGIYKKGL